MSIVRNRQAKYLDLLGIDGSLQYRGLGITSKSFLYPAVFLLG
jgi:hypothetical protein